MRDFLRLFALLGLLTFVGCLDLKNRTASQKPNVIIIYADDMGFGDLNCQNPNSKIPTPNLDQLASEGMRFTDAHSSSGICSPSRFALLTGTYHWRRQHDIVNSFGKPFFKETDVILPQVMKNAGYQTACIGKWHLGWDWPFKNGPSGAIPQNGNAEKYYQVDDIDWSKPISGGPLSRGFDYYFGDGTINFPPYAWIENDKFLELPTVNFEPNNMKLKTREGNWEFRPGPMVKDWNPYDVLPTLTKKTVEWIGKQEKGKPFFLYFALPSPHAPIIPNDEFIGKSKAGGYGDFMFQTDWVVGQVLNELKKRGLEKNTIVIFSADNGPEHYAFQRALKYGHFSMGDFRGLKRDVWEGGHHIPFIVKWPGQIRAGAVSNEVVSQVDLMATIARMTNTKLPQNAAPDSYDFLPVLKEEPYRSPLREATVQNTFQNVYGLRQGDWFYINNKTGQHTKMDEAFMKQKGYKVFETETLLFNLKDDPEQRINLSEKYPEKIKEMNALLEVYRSKGSSKK